MEIFLTILAIIFVFLIACCAIIVRALDRLQKKYDALLAEKNTLKKSNDELFNAGSNLVQKYSCRNQYGIIND